MRAASPSINHHAADRFTLLHQLEALVDVVQRHRVGDQIVDVDLAVHVPVDDLRHLGAAAHATERGALPHATGHELERTRPDLLTRSRDTDDDALAPAAMGAFQRLAHDIDVADAFE